MQCGQNRNAHRNHNYLAWLHHMCKQMDISTHPAKHLTKVNHFTNLRLFHCSCCQANESKGLGQGNVHLKACVTTISQTDALDVFGYVMRVIAEFPLLNILTQRITYSPSLFAFSNQTISPTVLFFLPCQHTDQMCKCCYSSPVPSSRQNERRGIFDFTSRETSFINFGSDTTVKKVAWIAWRIETVDGIPNNMIDPNELENPGPSRGLSRCYRHEKRYCFI